MKIKIKELIPGCMPEVIGKGEWIDLKSATTTELDPSKADTLKSSTCNGETRKYRLVESEVQLIPLGVAMKLPSGFEAIVAPRSSTPSKFGIICPNSIGIIDSSYSGNDDEWKFPAIAIRHTKIEEGNRICQFRIQLSQKATFWQKLKWLFSSSIKLEKVDNLDEVSRGGIGSTGIN